jgi:hypothetical protein
MRKMLLSLLCAALLPMGAQAGALDISDPRAYTSAHRYLAESLRLEFRDRGASAALSYLASRGKAEIPLRELCERCAPVAEHVGAVGTFEPSLWLYRPAQATGDAVIAFPPAGDDKAWQTIDALTMDGRWISLSVDKAPNRPVLVLRINGDLSFHKQVEAANSTLRDMGLQRTGLAEAATSGHWTTRLESIRLNNDNEPWISGAAEIYAVTSGVLTGNEPQLHIVDMPYLDDDGQTYSPRQIILDWANYDFGVANVQLFEHDDNTNYQQLIVELANAVAAGGSLFGQTEVNALAEIASRILQVMPSSWFSNDDDYVDSLYAVEKMESATRDGAGANVRASYIPFELPAN